jgi:hypothetical protein
MKTSKELKQVLNNHKASDKNNLKKQVDYYNRLKERGIAQKESYSLKSVAEI